MTPAQKIDRATYIRCLTDIHRRANLADTDQRQPWQNVSDAAEHCQRIEAIARDLMTPGEYQEWLDNL